MRVSQKVLIQSVCNFSLTWSMPHILAYQFGEEYFYLIRLFEKKRNKFLKFFTVGVENPSSLIS